MKYCVLTLVFLISYINTFGQTVQDKTEKHYLGGSLGLQFGTITNINVAPHYGYYLAKNLSVGLGGTYQYFHDTRYIQDLKLHIYGGRLFARFDILNVAFIHAEYEILAYKTDIYSQIREMEMIFSENTLFGAGYRQTFQQNSKSAGYIMLLFNANETIYTPYTNPVIRMGFEFHF